MIRIGVNRVEGVMEKDGPMVIIIDESIAIKVYPLEKEEPFTHWIGGSVNLNYSENGMQVYKDGLLIDESSLALILAK